MDKKVENRIDKDHRAKLTEKQYNKYRLLTPKEKTIYNSVIANFPKCSHEKAFDIALTGGISFNFVSK